MNAQRMEILINSDETCVATWRNIAIMDSRTRTTEDGCRAVQQAMARLVEQGHGQVGLLLVLRQGVPAPSAALRNALAEVLKTFHESISGLVVVLQETGFRAAALQSVVTGVLMAARPTYPTKTTASIEDASKWLAETLPNRGGATFDAADLVAAMDALGGSSDYADVGS